MLRHPLLVQRLELLERKDGSGVPFLQVGDAPDVGRVGSDFPEEKGPSFDGPSYASLAELLLLLCHLLVCLVSLSIFGFKLGMKPLCLFWEALD